MVLLVLENLRPSAGHSVVSKSPDRFVSAFGGWCAICVNEMARASQSHESRSLNRVVFILTDYLSFYRIPNDTIIEISKRDEC